MQAYGTADTDDRAAVPESGQPLWTARRPRVAYRLLAAARRKLRLLALLLQLAELAVDVALGLEGGETLVHRVVAEVCVGLRPRLLLLDPLLHPLELGQAADALDVTERPVHLLLGLRRAAAGDQERFLRPGLLDLLLELAQPVLQRLD